LVHKTKQPGGDKPRASIKAMPGGPLALANGLDKG